MDDFQLTKNISYYEVTKIIHQEITENMSDKIPSKFLVVDWVLDYYCDKVGDNYFDNWNEFSDWVESLVHEFYSEVE